jgi:hypothetical protein
MNKHSKYRPLLDKVECEIMRAEVGVTGVYQYMLEALDEAEAVETALREELAALKQSIPKIRAAGILSVLDTPYDCETPNGDIAWSSGSLQLISSFHLHANKIEDGS